MSAAYKEGDTVEWNRSGRTPRGKVVKVYTSRQTLTIKGSEITRNASADCPSYRIEQSDGDEVLKSHTEVSKV